MVKQIEVNGEQVILGESGALVLSRSQPGVWYVIRPIGGIQTCQCLAAQNGRSCRHVRAVEQLRTGGK